MSVRRRAAVTVAVVTLFTGVGASPPAADAHTDACGGVGTMGTPPMFYPGVPVGPAAGPMAMGLPICALGLFPAAGTIGGWCGYAWGSAFAAGHFFVFVAVGGVMVVTGAVTGVLNVVPDVAAGESCTPFGPGADTWLATGAVTLAP